jgi:tetratricopeptide (TPR) repeat protein
VTPAIRAKAAELTKDLKTDDEKIRAIYNFVSLRFHYIGLDFGIGRYQPHTADDVLGNGYGDCKDKHTLLASSLKAAGYDAWPALIHSQRKLDPELPSPAQFNHVITVVPIADQLIWLDTTPEVAPYGLLLNVLRDKQALVISSTKGPVLMRTPQNPPFPEDQEFSVEGKLGPDDVFTGHVEQSYRGDTEVVMRSWLRQVAQSQWKESVQGFSYRLGFAGDVSNVKASPPEDTDKPFKISYDYLRKDYGDWANRQFTAPLPPLGIEVTKDSRDKKPVEPVPLGAVGKIYYRSRIELPAGYSMVTPSPINLVEPYAEYHTTNAVENGLLTTSRRFDIKKNEVALDDWDSFRRFGRAVADDEFAFIRLRPSGADAAFDSLAGKDEDIGANDDIDDIFDKAKEALQRRDFARAQRLFERVIAKDAEYEDAHLDLGMALGAQRKYGEALAELRKEEEIAPDKVKTYQTAAAVTTMAGNRDEAIVQLRKLLKLDPQNSDASLSLSRWLSQDGDYSEAAEVLESAVKTSPKATPLQYALGSAYLEMGQADKAVTHLRAAVEDGGAPSHDPMLLNNVAYTLAEKKIRLELAAQYGEEALKELDERSINDVAAVDTGTRVTYQLSLVWDTLGWVYYQRGDTNRSESFVRAAWLLGQQAIVGEHLGEIYEKQGKSKEAAHLYQLALAAQSTPQFRVTQAATQLSSPAERSLDSKAYKEQHDRILSRYEKLTGKKPSVETRRLSNGEWTKTPAQELSEMRSIKLGKQAHLSGTAEFWIVFAMGEIESVQYVSGEEALEPLTEKLKAAHYPLGFPAGSKAKILRRAEVSCTPTAGCIAALVPPDNAQTGL